MGNWESIFTSEHIQNLNYGNQAIIPKEPKLNQIQFF